MRRHKKTEGKNGGSERPGDRRGGSKSQTELRRADRTHEIMKFHEKRRNSNDKECLYGISDH